MRTSGGEWKDDEEGALLENERKRRKKTSVASSQSGTEERTCLPGVLVLKESSFIGQHAAIWYGEATRCATSKLGCFFFGGEGATHRNTSCSTVPNFNGGASRSSGDVMGRQSASSSVWQLCKHFSQKFAKTAAA